jgi:acyl-coenzyme A synthetase/AMP-(fatty) acid ligase
VFIDELPRNPTGKILKRKLKESDAEGEQSDGQKDRGEEREAEDEARAGT